MYTWQKGAEEYINALSTSEPAPGGGSAACICAAQGAALALMAVRTTLKLKKTSEENKPALLAGERELEAFKQKFCTLSLEDATKYKAYTDLKKAKATQGEQDAALIEAAKVPSECALLCTQALDSLSSLKGKISPIIISDALCAGHMLRAALKCAVENILINKQYMKDEGTLKSLNEALLSAAEKLEGK